MTISKQGPVASLYKLGSSKMVGSSLYLKSRGFWVWRTHWTGLCILKPENVSPSCRDITVPMLLEMNFYFQLLRMHVLTWLFGAKNMGGGTPGSLPILRPRKGRDYHSSSGSSPIWDHFQWSVIFTVYQCCMGNLLPVLLFLLHDIIVSWDNNIYCNFTHHCQGKLQAKGNTKEKLSGQMSYFKWGSLEESDETVALSWKSINDQNKWCITLL